MVKPMDNILDICDAHSIPLTIMFEVMEYIAFEKYDRQLVQKLGYSPCSAIKEQMNTAYDKGHDIQLHIHPQFRDMAYDGKKFVLNEDIKHYIEWSQDEVKTVLGDGKETLESMVNSKDYACRALRLSDIGWRRAPKNTLVPMMELGLLVHTLCDQMPRGPRGYWDLGNGLYEIPIHSIPSSMLGMLNTRRLFLYPYIWFHTGIRTPGSKGKTGVNKKRSKWDLSKLTHKDMLKYLDAGRDRYDHHGYEVPLIMIGHTKDFFNQGNFDRFLKNIREDMGDEIRFQTLNNFIRENLL